MQVLLLLVYGPKRSPPYSTSDYGLAPPPALADANVFTGNLPSIKRTKETVAVQSPVPQDPLTKARMHDTPPRPEE